MLRPDFWWRSRFRLWRSSKNGSFSIGRSYHKGFMKTFLQQRSDYSVEVSHSPWKVTIPKGEDRLPTIIFHGRAVPCLVPIFVITHTSGWGTSSRGLKIEKSKVCQKHNQARPLAPWLSLAAMAWASGDTCAESCQGKWLSIARLKPLTDKKSKFR